MSYHTLLLHLGINEGKARELGVAHALAKRFDAFVIGTAACDPQPSALIAGSFTVDMLEDQRRYAKERLEAAEARFREGFAGWENRIDWRAAYVAPGIQVATLSRAADLVITGAVGPDLLADANWRLDPGNLVMQAGRPVLLVPETVDAFPARTMLIGWKDNRESRRAVQDALPLARRAERVLVASIAEEDEDLEARAGVADVLAWFRRHGIDAEDRCEPLISDAASQLRALAEDEDADLIVIGAYGHSRTREWVFGGVTHDFLTRPAMRCVLMSH